SQQRERRTARPRGQDSESGAPEGPGRGKDRAMSDRLVPLGKRAPEAGLRPVPAPDAPRVYVETYGCQMNVADTSLIGSVLADAGYATAARADDAEIIIINTCAVREKAEERVTARAAELGALKRKKPGTVLAI